MTRPARATDAPRTLTVSVHRKYLTEAEVVPRKLTPHQRAEALQRIAQGETQADIARLLNVSAPTISRLAATSPFEHGVAAGLG